jgi:hypothetical protein
MAGDISGKLEISGMTEVLAALEELPKAMKTSVVKQATYSAASALLVEAKRQCPVSGQARLSSLGKAAKHFGTPLASDLGTHASGSLRDSIRVEPVKTGRSRVGHRVIVGKGLFKGDQFYGAFVEFGHHVGSRNLGNRTFVMPNPFMRRAFELRKKDLLRLMINDTDYYMQQAVAKLDKKMNYTESAGQA